MKKTVGEADSLVQENIRALKNVFPDVFREDRIDFTALQQLLGDSVAEGEEKYGLNWHGKRKARQLALTAPSGTLRPCPDDSVDWDNTRNIFIEGDNLEVIKLLRRSYAGKVKLIYIDPPYNTGKDFVYPDDYRDGIRNYLTLTNQQNGSDGNGKLTSNTEVSGRFHTTWLNMIYPRLKIARTLLRDDGIFIASISDAEIHNLRSCLDEIFGSDNFLACIVWNSTKSVTNTAIVSVSHTYNLIYARNSEYFKGNRTHFRLPETGEGFSNPDNDHRGEWKADPFQVGGERPNQQYPIKNPNTGETYYPNPGNSWKNELSVFRTLLADDRIVFGTTGCAGPQRKRFLSEANERGRVSSTLWHDIDTTTNATRSLKLLMGSAVFDNPKPTSLIERFIQLAVHDTSGAIVMDFFAGSGTTGHAVMKQNAIDNGSRRFIAVQLPESLDENIKEQKLAARYCKKIGRPQNIAELAKERLRLAGKDVVKRNPGYSGDLGFKVFRLDSSNISIWNPDRNDLEQSLLDYTDHIAEGRSEQDILYELLLKRGVDLAIPIDVRVIAGKTVHSMGDGTLFACLDEMIEMSEIEDLGSGIAEWFIELDAIKKEAHVVFRDSAFADDVVKTNMCAMLEQNGIKHILSL